METLNGESPKPERRIRLASIVDDQRVHLVIGGALDRLRLSWLLEPHLRASQALARVLHYPPDVLLLEIGMSHKSGLERLHKLKAALPNLPIIVHTAHNETEVVLLSLLAGASGCLIKPVSPSELKLAVEDALAGETHLCPRAQTLLGRCLRGWAVVATAEAGLSPREQDVLLCLFQRLPNKDIAEKLKIAKATVHAHVINIFKKLEVHSRAGAARKALSLLVACGES